MASVIWDLGPRGLRRFVPGRAPRPPAEPCAHTKKAHARKPAPRPPPTHARARTRPDTPLAQEAPRKRKTLEQRRAVVLEKPEKRAAALLQQLNAIRNAKAGKRREQAARKRAARDKALGKEKEWRDK